MAAPNPGTEPEQFYKYAARRQKRGLATLPPPCDHRVPGARHVEMLRLRLLEGLSFREIGEQTGVSGGRVQQLLRHYFALQRELNRPVPRPEVNIPAGFTDLLRDVVLDERRSGREVIVSVLRKREAAEWKRLRYSKGAERRAVHVNLKRIGTFLASVGADRDV
jgi:hypothetical protein